MIDNFASDPLVPDILFDIGLGMSDSALERIVASAPVPITAQSIATLVGYYMLALRDSGHEKAAQALQEAAHAFFEEVFTSKEHRLLERTIGMAQAHDAVVIARDAQDLLLQMDNQRRSGSTKGGEVRAEQSRQTWDKAAELLNDARMKSMPWNKATMWVAKEIARLVKENSGAGYTPLSLTTIRQKDGFRRKDY